MAVLWVYFFTNQEITLSSFSVLFPLSTIGVCVCAPCKHNLHSSCSPTTTTTHTHRHTHTHTHLNIHTHQHTLVQLTSKYGPIIFKINTGMLAPLRSATKIALCCFPTPFLQREGRGGLSANCHLVGRINKKLAKVGPQGRKTND